MSSTFHLFTICVCITLILLSSVTAQVDDLDEMHNKVANDVEISKREARRKADEMKEFRRNSNKDEMKKMMRDSMGENHDRFMDGTRDREFASTTSRKSAREDRNTDRKHRSHHDIDSIKHTERDPVHRAEHIQRSQEVMKRRTDRYLKLIDELAATEDKKQELIAKVNELNDGETKLFHRFDDWSNTLSSLKEIEDGGDRMKHAEQLRLEREERKTTERALISRVREVRQELDSVLIKKEL